MKIGIVGCGKKKKERGKHKAKNLYTSLYSKLRIRYAEENFDQYFIFSGKHGLIDPNKMIEPYDSHISEYTSYELDTELNLSDAVISIVLDGVTRPEAHKDKEVVILAGKDYVEPIEQRLEKYVEINKPFSETSGIGEQIKFLKDNINDGQKKVASF